MTKLIIVIIITIIIGLIAGIITLVVVKNKKSSSPSSPTSPPTSPPQSSPPPPPPTQWEDKTDCFKKIYTASFGKDISSSVKTNKYCGKDLYKGQERISGRKKEYRKIPCKTIPCTGYSCHKPTMTIDDYITKYNIDTGSEDRGKIKKVLESADFIYDADKKDVCDKEKKCLLGKDDYCYKNIPECNYTCLSKYDGYTCRGEDQYMCTKNCYLSKDDNCYKTQSKCNNSCENLKVYRSITQPLELSKFEYVGKPQWNLTTDKFCNTSDACFDNYEEFALNGFSNLLGYYDVNPPDFCFNHKFYGKRALVAYYTDKITLQYPFSVDYLKIKFEDGNILSLNNWKGLNFNIYHVIPPIFKNKPYFIITENPGKPPKIIEQIKSYDSLPDKPTKEFNYCKDYSDQLTTWFYSYCSRQDGPHLTHNSGCNPFAVDSNGSCIVSYDRMS